MYVHDTLLVGLCQQESMRILPVAASGTSREAPVAMQLGGYHIPAHTQLWVWRP